MTNTVQSEQEKHFRTTAIDMDYSYSLFRHSSNNYIKYSLFVFKLYFDTLYTIFQGDGGGPLTCLAGKTRVLCGLFSWLYTFCDGDNPFAYTNVTHYASWIKRETGIEGFP